MSSHETRREKIVSGLAKWQKPSELPNPWLDVPRDGSIRTFDIATGEVESIDCGCAPHGLAQSPLDARELATTAKFGVDGAVVNFKTQSVVRLKAPEGRRFYGHVNYGPDGTLYATAATDDGRVGELLTIDPINGKILRTVKTGGHTSHDFYFCDSDTVIIANSGLEWRFGSLTWLSVSSGEIIKIENVRGAGHIVPVANNQILIGALFFDDHPGLFKLALDEPPGSARLRSLDEHEHYDAMPLKHAEGLSVAAFDDDMLLCTTSYTNGLLLWQPRSGRYDRFTFGTAMTKGLTVHAGSAWMTTAGRSLKRLTIMNRSPLELKVEEIASEFGNSAHILAVKM